MPWDPIAHHGCKRPRLQIETAIIPRRKAKRIFVETNLGAAITGVEPAVQPRLSKEINLRPKLCIEKQRQTRIEEIVAFAVDESRRRLLEMIDFKVDRAAESRASNDSRPTRRTVTGLFN
jgi:hypothetical protein